MQKFIDSKKITLIGSFLGLYLISAGVSLLVFTYLPKQTSTKNIVTTTGRRKSKINLDLPKTETCPINGVKYTKAEADIWNKRRPLLAMIENHLDSRPQSGLSKADIVYEAVAEGGITRFLAVFYCGVASDDYIIGQIRSARVYFINFAAEYGSNPLYIHWGGANNICNSCPGGVKPYGDINPKVDAYKLLEKIGWVNGRYGNDLNGATNAGYPALYTDDRRLELATEHQKVGSTDKIYEEAIKRKYEYKDENGTAWDESYVPWKFKDGKPNSSPTASSISFIFWDNEWKQDYAVEWKYDQTTNLYKRFNGGQPHIDLENKEQLTTSNIVVMYAKEEGSVDKEHHVFYTNIGTGKAVFFKNGEVVEGKWTKKTMEGRTLFTDMSGDEIEFTTGVVWIEMLPEGSVVNY